MTAVYVHIPFCKQKCKYCDFNSYAAASSLYEVYIDALISEIIFRSSELRDLNVKSIYIGGGTPTLLTPFLLEKVLTSIKKHFLVAKDAEVSIEANPETLTADKAVALRQIGINRMSIGFQSLDNDCLRALGRKHTAKQAINAFKVAREAGFDNINVDLIFGAPGQSLAGWALTLEQAISLEPEHVSCYGLTVEPGTRLEHEIASGKLKVADQDLQSDMFVYAIKSLNESGYEHYEISNYAKGGKQCKHNLVYWNNGDYIGFGAGAHSKIGNKRFHNVLGIEDYINSSRDYSYTEGVLELTMEGEMSDTIILGLRKMEGISLKDFESSFGISLLNLYAEQVKELISDGFVRIENGRLKLTQKGILLGNEVFLRFI
ncbi:MAG: radical SAM family heme chaperone HemW [Actinomycetota bacterium]|nr:radical SAM family heme chaperone HemW [Actinomycetota bacterium]